MIYKTEINNYTPSLSDLTQLRRPARSKKNGKNSEIIIF